MEENLVSTRIDALVSNIEGLPLADLLFVASDLLAAIAEDMDERKQLCREFASASIAAHYAGPYMAELKRRDDERVRLNREVAMIDSILSAMFQDDPGKGVLLKRKKALVSQIEIQFHMMAIASSMVRRLLPRMIHPVRGQLDSRKLDLLNQYEQLRHNFEHFDERLPGRSRQEWMVQESESDGEWRISMGLPLDVQGRVVLNGQTMEFSTTTVNAMLAAYIELEDEVRRKTIAHVRDQLAANPYDFPTEIIVPTFIRHERSDIPLG